MDFLDPKKQKAHSIRIIVGYALIGILLLLSTIILLYQSYGFGIDRNGQVIQNGLVFFSSQPAGANIVVDGQDKGTTNARLVLTGGNYTVQLQRTGYRTWQRAVTVEGGSVERFDYPLLFPTSLRTIVAKAYAAAPLLATQSTDRRWLLVQSDSADQFDLIDLNQAPLQPRPLVVPSDMLAAGTTTTGWQAISWADDNRHVLLKRTYQKAGKPGSEIILFDRQEPAQSQNLSVLFGFTPTTIAYQDNHYDQYYLYDQNAAQLLTATLKKPTPLPFVQDVASFAADGDSLLYITPDGAAAGNVTVRMQKGQKTYALRQIPASSSYALDLAVYKNVRLVAAGSEADGRVYVYRDPATVLDNKQVLVPSQILKVPNVTTTQFSTDARFVMAENATQFAVYDAEIDKGYAYNLTQPLDAPQVHAVWIDGAHLSYSSGGKLQVFDYDGSNLQGLNAANPQYLPFFGPNYHTLFTLNAENILTQTSLLATIQ